MTDAQDILKQLYLARKARTEAKDAMCTLADAAARRTEVLWFNSRAVRAQHLLWEDGASM